MRLRYLSAAAVIVSVAAIATVVHHRAAQPFKYHYENVLGTSMDVTVIAYTEAEARAATGAVLDRIDGDAKILSGYDPSSEFSRWFKTSNIAVPVSPELYDVLGLFDSWRARSGGALDASAEAVSRVWKSAASEHRLPSDDEIASAVHQVRQPHWRLDAAAHTATHLDQTPIILNSFTKSYIVDRAAAAAMRLGGVRGVVVNIGGDLVTRGAWTETVGVTDPLDNADNAVPLTRLAVSNRAVATSGNYRRGFDINGRHYSHIVDPRSGRPTSRVISATVVANHAADAGALATAFCVLTPEDSERLADTVPGAEFLIVLADGTRVHSAGWRALSLEAMPRIGVPAPVASVYAAPGQAALPDHEMNVTIDLAQFQGRAERPFVAIWVEDKDKFPVRTLTVLYRDREARYLAELRAWYRADRLRAMAEGTEILGSVSSATRAPGKYSFKWDLKDEAGKPVKPGSYTVCIEAAREHGTYQLMRQPIDLTGADKQVTVPINGVEITAASIDYHKTAGK